MLNLALFMDYENIHISLSKEYNFTLDVEKLLPLVRERTRASGTLLIQKAYADWEDFPQLQSKLDHLGVEPQYVLSKKVSRKDIDGKIRVASRKNSCDIAMGLDILETLYSRPEIDLFVLITGDRDFIIPIRRLRSRQKEVMVFGVDRTTSRDLLDSLLEESCFVSIESLLGIQAVLRVEREVLDFSSPDFDWGPFVSRFHSLEQSLPFVSLKYLRDSVLDESMGCGQRIPSKTRFLNEAISQKIVLTGKVPNPNIQDTFTTTLKLNKDHPLVQGVLEQKKAPL